jgi:DNA-directed RNA polymerase specialized sigma24 family protein
LQSADFSATPDGHWVVTLLQAFRELGPIVDGHDATRTIRETAARILLDMLETAARWLPAEYREDVVMEVLAHLLSSGPRGAGRGPDSHEQVERFLKRCLRNGAIDHIRRQGREVSVEFDLDLWTGTDPSPEDTLDAEKAAALLMWARMELYERIIPAIAKGLAEQRPERRDFLEAIGHLRAMAEGRATFKSILASLPAREDAALPDRLYQRHCRARKRVIAFAEAWLLEMPLHDAKRRALCIAVSELQPRMASRRSLRDRLLKIIRRRA